MDGDELGAVGKSRLDLDVVDHLGDPLHHLVAADDMAASLHQIGDRAPIASTLDDEIRSITPVPGATATVAPGDDLPLTPDYQAAILKGQCIPEMLTPQAMAGPLVFLCSDQSRYVTGQELAVDAGLTHG